MIQGFLKIKLHLLTKKWRRQAQKHIVIGNKLGPKNRYSVVKNLAQAGIYRICAAHLEEVLKGRL